MKIGIVCYPTHGGSGVVATELGAALADNGHDVHIISYAIPFRFDSFRKNLRYHEVEVSAYPLFRYPPYDLALAGTIMEVAQQHGLDILHAQEFRSGIPAGLPEAARVAHKTGEMSTVAHDAGIVYLGDRAPYVLTVLTEWEQGASGRSAAIASISRNVYEHVSAELTVDAESSG